MLVFSNVYASDLYLDPIVGVSHGFGLQNFERYVRAVLLDIGVDKGRLFYEVVAFCVYLSVWDSRRVYVVNNEVILDLCVHDVLEKLQVLGILNEAIDLFQDISDMYNMMQETVGNVPGSTNLNENSNDNLNAILRKNRWPFCDILRSILSTSRLLYTSVFGLYIVLDMCIKVYNEPDEKEINSGEQIIRDILGWDAAEDEWHIYQAVLSDIVWLTSMIVANNRHLACQMCLYDYFFSALNEYEITDENHMKTTLVCMRELAKHSVYDNLKGLEILIKLMHGG